MTIIKPISGLYYLTNDSMIVMFGSKPTESPFNIELIEDQCNIIDRGSVALMCYRSSYVSVDSARREKVTYATSNSRKGGSQ